MTHASSHPDSGEHGAADPLRWRVVSGSGCVICAFEITRADGLLEPGDLVRIDLPGIDIADKAKGLVLSGRGPIWLYALLVHLAHPYAWVGVFDPRLESAVVTQRHRSDAPPLGSLVKLKGIAV